MTILHLFSQNFLSRGRGNQVRALNLIHHVKSSKICNRAAFLLTRPEHAKSKVEIDYAPTIRKHSSREGKYLCSKSTSQRNFTFSACGSATTEYFQLRPSYVSFSTLAPNQTASKRALGVYDAFTHHYLQYSTKKSKSRKKNKVQKDESDDEDTEEEDEEEEFDEWDQENEAGDDVKKDWKDLKMNVPSMRIDAVLSTGLGTSRKKIEDAFLSGKLRHNGKKVLKKSKQVSEGDVLDLVRDDKAMTKDGELVTMVMRVEVRRVKDEKTPSEKTPVALRRWKQLEIPREK